MAAYSEMRPSANAKPAVGAHRERGPHRADLPRGDGRGATRRSGDAKYPSAQLPIPCPEM